MLGLLFEPQFQFLLSSYQSLVARICCNPEMLRNVYIPSVWLLRCWVPVVLESGVAMILRPFTLWPKVKRRRNSSNLIGGEP